MKKLVFGHKNPDTDSICSALTYMLGEKELNREIEAVALGEPNKETKYVLDYLNIATPRIIDSVEDEQEVVMVDHNEFNQSVKNIENANILAVYDHHRVANFSTQGQVKMDVQPIGCTSTVLYKKFISEKTNITHEMAVLMMSAIISDSLLFKSPTCTKEDKEACESLAKIAKIDIQEYGLKMLKAGTALDEVSTKDLLNIDKKEFKMGDDLVEIAQINTVDIEEIIEKRNSEIVTEIENVIKDNKLSAFLFIITDIVNCNSKAYVLGEKKEAIATKLEKEINNDLIDLPGVVSRKKQIVPFL